MFFQYYFQKTSRLVDGQSGSVLESLGSECGSERGGGADERTHVMCVVAWLLAGWREGEEVISLVSERERGSVPYRNCCWRINWLSSRAESSIDSARTRFRFGL